MNTLTKRALACALVLLSLSGCAGLRVTSDANPTFAAGACKSYAWAHEAHATGSAPPVIGNPLIESRLRAAIAANLASHGLQPASSPAAASCIVAYAIGRRTVVEGGYPVGWGWGWPGPYGYLWDGPYVYRRALLAVNLYDGVSREPLWHAEVEDDLSGLVGREAEARINTDVAALFARYPH